MKVDFKRLTWENYPSTETPINADNLNRLEEGVAGLYSDVAEIEEELDGGVGEHVTNWLNEHVDPVGSAVVVDNTLSIEGAAADAKKTGDEISSLKEDFNDAITTVVLNLFDGVFSYFCLNSGGTHYVQMDSTQAKRSAVVDCDGGKTYSIIRNVADAGFGRIGVFSCSKDEIVDGTIPIQYIDIGGLGNYTITVSDDAKSIAFYATYTSQNPLVQIVEGIQTTFTVSDYSKTTEYLPNKLEVYTKVEVDNKIKKCKIGKTGNKLDIYMPSRSSSNYIHFAYQLVADANANMNQWKVMDTDVCDGSLNVLFNLYASSNNVEWEGVVKETGASDFIGGFHGDETNTMLSVMVDGEIYDMSSDHDISECDEIFIVNKSIVNSCDDTSNQIFTRYKVSTWTKDKYTIRNRWIVLKSGISLQLVYLTMFSLPIVKGSYEVATNGRYDDGYIIQDPRESAVAGSCLYNSSYAKTVEFWGDNFYGRAKAIYDNYDNYLCICDRSQSNIFKGYWRQYKNGITLNINDELNGLSEFEFFC